MIEVRFSKTAEKWSLSKSEKPGRVPNKILLLGFCWDGVRLSCQHFVRHIWFWYAFYGFPSSAWNSNKRILLEYNGESNGKENGK